MKDSTGYHPTRDDRRTMGPPHAAFQIFQHFTPFARWGTRRGFSAKEPFETSHIAFSRHKTLFGIGYIDVERELDDRTVWHYRLYDDGRLRWNVVFQKATHLSLVGECTVRPGQGHESHNAVLRYSLNKGGRFCWILQLRRDSAPFLKQNDQATGCNPEKMVFFQYTGQVIATT